MGFGVSTDYFGLADTHTHIQSSSLTPATGGNAQVIDSDGTIVCETVHGDRSAYSATYHLVGGGDTLHTRNIDTLAMIGEIFAVDTNTDAVINGVSVNTSNTTFPVFTVEAEEYFGDTSQQTLTFASGVSVRAIKKAQAVGFVPDTGSRVSSSSVTISGQIVHIADSVGDLVQTAVYQGRAEASGELAACSGTPGAAADTGWTLNQGVSLSSDNASYGTASVAVFKNLASA